MTQQQYSNGKAWSVVAAALGINLILGILYAWGVIGKALVVQWQWTRTEAALPFTIATASFAIMIIFAGRMQDRIGPRYVVMLGGLLFGGGLIASGFAHSPLLMVLTFGLLGGVGMGLGYSATTPPAIKWFPPARKGLITGIVVSGVGIAAVYASPLAQFLLGRTTIANTFFILGIGTIVVVCVLAQVLANPPAGYVPAPARSTGAAHRAAVVARRDYDWHEMLRSAHFYRLWIMFILAASAGLMIIAHVAIIAREQANWEGGFVPVILLAIFNTAGRLMSGYVSDRIGRRETMILAFTVQAANMFAFAWYTTPALLMAGSALTGLCYGAIYTLMPAATADQYGVRNLGVNYGLLFTGFGVAGVLGPIVGGRIRDLAGSYNPSYTVSAVLLLIAAGFALANRHPNPQVPDLQHSGSTVAPARSS